MSGPNYHERVSVLDEAIRALTKDASGNVAFAALGQATAALIMRTEEHYSWEAVGQQFGTVLCQSLHEAERAARDRLPPPPDLVG